MDALVFDLETTGLVINRTVRRDHWPEVIEFAAVAVDLDTGVERAAVEHLVRPLRPLEEKITAITGITNFDLVNRPAFAKLADEVAALIEGSELVVAHNASFDVEVLDMEFERLDRKLAWPTTICTVEQTIGLCGWRLSLGDLYRNLFGLAHADAHRAMADVRALARCCVELRRRGVL